MEARMRDWTYRLLAAGLQSMIWGGEIIGDENLPMRGPAVLVANHHGALGPIAVMSSVPHRLYPWVVADMMDVSLAPDYLRMDFVEKQIHLSMPFSLWIAKAISKLSVPLLTNINCIPVHSNFEDLLIPFEQSVDMLLQERFILIFPEDPTLPLHPQFNMAPFKKGFVRLGEFYFQRTGRALKFHPLAVHAARRVVQVGKPVTHNPFAPPVSERIRVKQALENIVREMLAGMDGNIYLRVPLPR
jgi:1-acyl-sn-glycerol-3-phosphate acyltransferase